MGLDSYAAKVVALDSSVFPGNNLIGGMFSGGGNSFRGKVYNDWVEFVTNQTLYEEMIDSNTIKKMADQMEAFVYSPGSWDTFVKENGNEFGITEDDTKELTKWFRVLADNDGVLIGWW